MHLVFLPVIYSWVLLYLTWYCTMVTTPRSWVELPLSTQLTPRDQKHLLDEKKKVWIYLPDWVHCHYAEPCVCSSLENCILAWCLPHIYSPLLLTRLTNFSTGHLGLFVYIQSTSSFRHISLFFKLKNKIWVSMNSNCFLEEPIFTCEKTVHVH